MIELTPPQDVGMCPTRLAGMAAHINRYVDDGRLPGYLVLVARSGRPVYLHRYGRRDVQADLPVEEDTIFRIYSMTKPVTAVALLSLYERGYFQLNDPVSRFVPAFRNLQVFDSGDADNYTTRPPDREVTFRDLLTHTAGLTYGLFEGHPVDALYQRNKVMGGSLQDMIDRLVELPLIFSPGTRWNYSVATDVLGYLVELISGQPLDQYLEQHIFQPLGMTDTGFWVPEDKHSRLAACYDYRRAQDGSDGFAPVSKGSIGAANKFLARPALFSGGGGLVSTVRDYFRFSQMLLNFGQYNGERILGRKTVELMTSNHLPGNADLSGMGMPVFSETPYDGIGFGLGVSVVLDPAASQILGSAGEYAWGGVASTAFWNDPAEQMSVVFMTQLIPSSSYQIRRELRVLAYQAITAAVDSVGQT